VTAPARRHRPLAHPVLRWHLGHQAFHLLLVTINSVLEEAAAAARRGDAAALAAALGRLARLLDAASANMSYTAAFPRAQYSRVVRPSMAPPYLSPGFSGTLNREHRVMFGEMKRLRLACQGWLGNQPARWPEPLAAAWNELMAAIERNRQHHVLVCEQFVPEGGSLLKDHFALQRRAETPARPRAQRKEATG
jgi:hypothetical protein